MRYPFTTIAGLLFGLKHKNRCFISLGFSGFLAETRYFRGFAGFSVVQFSCTPPVPGFSGVGLRFYCYPTE